MATISFTQNLQRHVKSPPTEVTGSCVREALEAAFAENPAARSYILDDRGGLRRHITLFVDGNTVKDRTGLSDPIEENSELYVMQALSGG